MAVLKIVSPRTRRVSWAAVITYRDENDTRRQVRRTFATRNEAKKGEAELLKARDTGRLTPQSRTRLQLGAWLIRWLDSRTGLRPRSIARYRYITANITKTLGAMDIARVSPLDVANFYASLRAGGMQESTVLMHHSLLVAVYRAAKRLEIVERNVMESVDAPRPGRRVVAVMTPDELERVIAAADAMDAAADAKDAVTGALVRLIANTGLRIREALAIRYDDISDGALFVSADNSKNGRPRRIGLPTPILEIIDALPRVSDRPIPVRYNDAQNRWHAIRTAAGVEHIRGYHALRHYHGSILLANGAPVTAVAARLGHNVNTLLRTYAHAMPNADAEIVKTVERVMR